MSRLLTMMLVSSLMIALPASEINPVYREIKDFMAGGVRGGMDLFDD